jgi:hypothetical protein
MLLKVYTLKDIASITLDSAVAARHKNAQARNQGKLPVARLRILI